MAEVSGLGNDMAENVKCERIVAAAMRDTKTHLIYMVSHPKRHHHINIALADLGASWPVTKGKVQGFVTSEGRFVDRVEALHIAKTAGQMLDDEPEHAKYLFSENVW